MSGFRLIICLGVKESKGEDAACNETAFFCDPVKSEFK